MNSSVDIDGQSCMIKTVLTFHSKVMHIFLLSSGFTLLIFIRVHGLFVVEISFIYVGYCREMTGLTWRCT